jgi:DNA mismatch repair protein MutL
MAKGDVAGDERAGTSRIHRLSDHLVNKIAAGEVVERPASAVKELVENALDAGATTVAVDLKDGGAARIRVADDGIGMTPAELELALERHATSKIATETDLAAIATLGFRGEALPAICAVSRFVIVTSPRPGGDGGRVAGQAGSVVQRLQVPAGAGTSVEVTDLFFNTPARLKFLKSPATELAATLRLLAPLAYAHPRVRFTVTNNGRVVLNAPAALALRDRAGALLGWELAAQLLSVDRKDHGIAVAGVISPPSLSRASRDEILTIVNGRPVRDLALLQAILDAFRPLLPRDRFPVAVLTLSVPVEDVDVNVHPTKAWVRFRSPRLVQEMVFAAVQEALRRPEVVARVGEGATTAFGGFAPTDQPATQPGLFAEETAPYARPLFGRVLGQVQETFVVAATDDEVFFIDQHVAHERVIFERLQAELAQGPLASQELLVPQPVGLGPAARAALERWRSVLDRLGFALEDFGGDVALRAVPALLAGQEPRVLVERLLDEMRPAGGATPEVDRALSFVACRAAIKAREPLAREEMERLVADLGRTATPYFCPHGRPVVSRVSLSEIRKELKRTW